MCQKPSRRSSRVTRARRAIGWASCLAAIFVCAAPAAVQEHGDALERGFKSPPNAAQPRTWWHWTNGNVTQEGITKDLEWMRRVGIGGFQLADVGFGSGQTVERRVWFGSAQWLDAVRHAAAEADRLGLEMAIFSSPGWSETGGPWVKPEQAMKKLVWSETVVSGPRRVTEKLASPPSNNGPIRNLAAGGRRPGAPPDPTYYGDSAVVAFRTPPDEARMSESHPRTTSHAGALDASVLLDDDLNTSLTLSAPEGGGPAWLQCEFERPFTARAISLAGRGGIPVGRVLASDDGATWRTLVTLPGPQLYRGGTVRTFAFPEVRARFYRVELSGAPLTPATVMSEPPSEPAREYVLSELVLHTGGRVHRWEEKAGFGFLYQYESVPTPAVSQTAAISRAEVIDLTSQLSKDGSLDWDVPPGRWTILRMGYSLTGAKNRPPVAAGLGYEADKLSPEHMGAYFHGYMDPISQALGPLVGKSLRYMLIDSWEAGMQNWTEDMLSEFRRRRGYDPTPYLPALAGRIVESAELSDRFLWDFRRTLADMFADNHYGVLAEQLRQRGMASYAEASGASLEVLEDTLLNKSRVDIPMGEFWMHDLHPSAMYLVDVHGAASAAHGYGKPLVAAEAFTGGGFESPYALKKVADRWFAEGINRLVFHTSAHQPLDTKPGNTMVGTHINRNITWAEQAGPFMTHLARTSFLLQQGLAVADIAYLLNEGAPSTMPFWGQGVLPTPPAGYRYDYVNADIVMRRMSVNDDGRLVLPDGMSYRVLVLPQTDTMTPALLRAIRDLVTSGATIVGPHPTRAPGLAGYPESDREVQSLADDLWGDLDGVSRTRRVYGKGRVVWGQPLSTVLDALEAPADFECNRPLDSAVTWTHRREGAADIYFVANLADDPVDLSARFRVSGKEAEIWHPDSGATEPAEYAMAGGRTTVPLRLLGGESIFVVFRRTGSSPARRLPRPGEGPRVTKATLGGPWELSFPPNLGAPPRFRMDRLESWTASADEGVKFFSGTATYTQSFQAPAAWFRAEARLRIDLGTVRDVAEVLLNGRKLGILWKPPYEVDVSGALKPGTNRLEIRVTNEWTNRQVGDQKLPVERRILAPIGAFGPGPDSPLPAGLFGPVTIVSAGRDDRQGRPIPARMNTGGPARPGA
jgi:hypothetical protein